jgi:hypothetical protein
LHINRQVNPTRKQTDITVLPRCTADLSPFPLPPHVFADTSIYHTDYHSSKTIICKWLYATEQATVEWHFLEERHKERYSSMFIFLNSVHCFSGTLAKVTTDENSATHLFA